MRHLLALLPLLLILSPSHASGQVFDGLEFGTDNTFEVVTWNIEWFPKAGQTTVDYVAEIIEAMDADLIAMQELNDQAEFDQMMAALPDYVGYYQSLWFAGLAYIYDPNEITINSIYEIYTTSEYWNAFPRSPMVMDLTFQGERIYVINNHYKCCGDGVLEMGNTSDEEFRRYTANDLLKTYIDTNLPNSNVIVTGDLNDILTDATSDNVFQMMLDDPVNYLFADLAIEQAGSSEWSFPNWPSHLDHILVTDELVAALSNAGSAVATIKPDDHFSGGFSEYDQFVSDHRPVGMRLDFGTSVSVPTLAQVGTGLTSSPNPFNPRTVISYNLRAASFVNLSVYNSMGQRIEVLVDAAMPIGVHRVEWDAQDLPSGVYFLRLTGDGSATTHKMLRLK